MYFYYFFASIVIFIGCKSLRGGINYLNYFKRQLARPKSDYQPFASVFIPCRGLDQDLKKNLEAHFRQDYPDYQVVFIVDDKRDDAFSLIGEFLHSHPDQTKLVIAGKASNEGQKVHNLRAAIAEVSRHSEVLVFADSDARPDSAWLRNLVAPLEDKEIGCATGYRWFVAKNGGFANHLRSVWNASIASALGENTKNNFCWGGSTAIRIKVFEELCLLERLKGTLSDDFTITRAMRESGRPIYFVPQCLTVTVEECGFGELLEFTTRQMKITRVYAAHLWKASLIGSALFSLTFWGGFLLLIFISGWHFWITAILLGAILALGIGKAWLRLTAVKSALPDYKIAIESSFFWQISLWTITPLLFFYNSFCALRSNEIVWRGIRYTIKSPTETIISSGDSTNK